MTDNKLVRLGAMPAERTRYLVRGRIAPQLIDLAAVSRDDAVPFTPAGRREGREFAAMLRSGAVKRLADGRCWFDMAAYEAAAARRTRLLVPVLVVAAVIVAFIATRFYAGGTPTLR